MFCVVIYFLAVLPSVSQLQKSNRPVLLPWELYYSGNKFIIFLTDHV
jgi:hypothetical protein